MLCCRVLLDDGSMVSQPDNYHVTDTPQNVGLLQTHAKQTTQHPNITSIQYSPEQVCITGWRGPGIVVSITACHVGGGVRYPLSVIILLI